MTIYMVLVFAVKGWCTLCIYYYYLEKATKDNEYSDEYLNLDG